jgi:O-methyltransferase
MNPWETDHTFAGLMKEVSGRTLVDHPRCWVLHKLAITVKDMPGDVAEIGVYKGGTLRLIARSVPEKMIHAFDTFDGMPAVCEKDNYCTKGMFSDTSLEEVEKYISDLKNIKLYMGRFPETTTEGLDHKTFCLVHVDVDIYTSVISCCEYFWPRLTSGGAMVFDDYGWPTCLGAKIAVREFSDRIGIKETPLITRQAILFKP